MYLNGVYENTVTLKASLAVTEQNKLYFSLLGKSPYSDYTHNDVSCIVYLCLFIDSCKCENVGVALLL